MGVSFSVAAVEVLFMNDPKISKNRPPPPGPYTSEG